MPGPTPKPADQRRTRHKPLRGEWRSSPSVGWQHGPVPAPPDDLLPASTAAWQTWFRSWVAAHWYEADVPGLRTVIRLYDQVARGKFQRSAELRMWSDTYGLTPKGRQDRRWAPPKAEDPPPPTEPDPYRHLRVVPPAETLNLTDGRQRRTAVGEADAANDPTPPSPAPA